MWGTGFPGVTRAEAGRDSIQQELDLIRKEIPFFTSEDRAKILGRNAVKLWKFEAT
jgi:predicted TIM-barrel fold metal-dependent hydrolase